MATAYAYLILIQSFTAGVREFGEFEPHRRLYLLAMTRSNTSNIGVNHRLISCADFLSISFDVASCRNNVKRTNSSKHCRTAVVVAVPASQVQPVDCAAFTKPKLITDSSIYGSSQENNDDVSGYLASYYAQTLGHGRPDCPWTISVRPGQRIQLTLIDFSTDARYHVDGGHHGPHHEQGPPGPPASAASAVSAAVPDFCYRYAQVSEGSSTSRRYTVCAEERREQIVYTSSSNVLNVEITDTVLADAAINFLIKYNGNYRYTLTSASAAKHIVLIGAFKMLSSTPSQEQKVADNSS